MYGGDAVCLILTLLLRSPVQLRLPENLGFRKTTLCNAGGHQWLIATVQQSCGACGHVHFWLHCEEKEEGEEMTERGKDYKMNIDPVVNEYE